MDYNDNSLATRCNFRPQNWKSEPMAMLSISKDQAAPQEYVGNKVKLRPNLTSDRQKEKAGLMWTWRQMPP